MRRLTLIALMLTILCGTAYAEEPPAGPTTPVPPVPPVPTQEEINDAIWQRIRQIDMEISASLADQRLWVYLLEHVDPSGEHAALLRSRLAAERHRVLMLKLEREALLFELFGE
jgi:hypothetical protein